MDYANIILEMLNRIKKLEQEVAELKRTSNDVDDLPFENDKTYAKYADTTGNVYSVSKSGKRDTTRYLFAGNIYLKNRLVLAVVQAYVEQNPSITRQQLKRVFDKSLQGSIGVVENIDVAEIRSDFTVRFFTKPTEIIHLCDGDMYVCTQWGILNIPNFIKRAEQLGFDIESIQ